MDVKQRGRNPENQAFTIVCNSRDGTGASKNSLDYTFNFGDKYKGDYELTFSFMSAFSISVVNPLLLQLSGLNAYNYQANASVNQTGSNTLGILNVRDETSDNLVATYTDNPPLNITLSGTTNFNLSLLEFNKALWGVTDVDYVCILHFKPA